MPPPPPPPGDPPPHLQQPTLKQSHEDLIPKMIYYHFDATKRCMYVSPFRYPGFPVQQMENKAPRHVIPNQTNSPNYIKPDRNGQAAEKSIEERSETKTYSIPTILRPPSPTEPYPSEMSTSTGTPPQNKKMPLKQIYSYKPIQTIQSGIRPESVQRWDQPNNAHHGHNIHLPPNSRQSVPFIQTHPRNAFHHSYSMRPRVPSIHHWDSSMPTKSDLAILQQQQATTNQVPYHSRFGPPPSSSSSSSILTYPPIVQPPQHHHTHTDDSYANHNQSFPPAPNC